MKISHLLLAIILASPASFAANNIRPGQPWSDTSGKHINAHGGGMQYLDGTYYWFGEDRTGYDSNGISCYTSTDLYNWKRVGLVFKASQAIDPDTKKCILERPKVVYNDKTGKWVMYIHWENGDGYGEARVCVAVSDKIDGSYEFVSTFRPNNHDSRDQTIFKDSDGKAYHFGSTDMNTNMNVALLTDDYLTTETNPVTETKILKGLRYEAPAIIKVGDTYFGVFSGCTGWDPNPGHSATATEILGYWTPGRNFAIDNGAATTYQSQSTYIFPVAGKEGAYVYMGDRWNSKDVGGKSEYVWLPLSLRSGAPTVKWYDSWDMSAFDNCDRFARLAKLTDGALVRFLDKYSDRWVSTTGNGFFIDDDNDATNLELQLKATDNPYVWQLADPKTGKNLESLFGALVYSEPADGKTQQWRFELEEDGCYIIQNVNDGKVLAVSGASQLAKSPVFMSAPSSNGSQSFGIYFDARKHDYDKADMFSAAYRNANIEAIAAQKEYEKGSGVEAALAETAMQVYSDGATLSIVSTRACDALVRIVEAASGRVMYQSSVALSGGANSIALGQSLASGIYMAEVTAADTRVIRKLAIR